METVPVKAQSPPQDDSLRQRFINRELSWLQFARRVMAQLDRDDLPLLERVKFAGIVGMLHDEFFMKRMTGLKRQMEKRPKRRSIDGRLPAEEFLACRQEIAEQKELFEVRILSLRSELYEKDIPILSYSDLDSEQIAALRSHFQQMVQPTLTPLAVDAEHPFPFITSGSLNLAVLVPEKRAGKTRFVRIKVPDNQPRWVHLPEGNSGGAGVVPLEQVISANLDLMFPTTPPQDIFIFRVIRGAESSEDLETNFEDDPTTRAPGRIVEMVSKELKARRFAGVVRLDLEDSVPQELETWLCSQLDITSDDVYRSKIWLKPSDLLALEIQGREELRSTPFQPLPHHRIGLQNGDPGAIFDEIRQGDLLLHHPYHSFDTSVTRLLESAAKDPQVLAIKLTIYRTNQDSRIVKALASAAHQGKEVAVLVEITARFDEAPNIAWGQVLEREGAHVAYGVEKLKTHVKLALIVRQEGAQIRRYAHVGTGNYNSRTARQYEDLGLLTCNQKICTEVAAVFNELTGATPCEDYRYLLTAPASMRSRVIGLIRREAKHAKAGRPSGIRAKMNQLQDAQVIKELYKASQAGVPICLQVRGLCCLRPGVAELSETIRVFSIVDRYLEHSRIYIFQNGGEVEHFIGSADWMKRNLDRRFEVVAPVLNDSVKQELDAIWEIYEKDNCSAWDCLSDGTYRLRTPDDGDSRRAAQNLFIEQARE
jgi:polyphosphate kinase